MSEQELRERQWVRVVSEKCILPHCVPIGAEGRIVYISPRALYPITVELSTGERHLFRADELEGIEEENDPEPNQHEH